MRRVAATATGQNQLITRSGDSRIHTEAQLLLHHVAVGAGEVIAALQAVHHPAIQGMCTVLDAANQNLVSLLAGFIKMQGIVPGVAVVQSSDGQIEVPLDCLTIHRCIGAVADVCHVEPGSVLNGIDNAGGSGELILHICVVAQLLVQAVLQTDEETGSASVHIGLHQVDQRLLDDLQAVLHFLGIILQHLNQLVLVKVASHKLTSHAHRTEYGGQNRHIALIVVTHPLDRFHVPLEDLAVLHLQGPQSQPILCVIDPPLIHVQPRIHVLVLGEGHLLAECLREIHAGEIKFHEVPLIGLLIGDHCKGQVSGIQLLQVQMRAPERGAGPIQVLTGDGCLQSLCMSHCHFLVLHLIVRCKLCKFCKIYNRIIARHFLFFNTKCKFRAFATFLCAVFVKTVSLSNSFFVY